MHPRNEKNSSISVAGHHVDDFADVRARLGIIGFFRVFDFIAFAKGSRKVLLECLRGD